MTELGKALAQAGHVVVTGSCHGYPNEAAKAAYISQGKVIGISPANNKEEHISTYKFPTDNFSEIIYTGHAIPGRNLDIINYVDYVIIIDGRVGTLNEFTLAFQLLKPIGILKVNNGLSNIIPAIVKQVKRDENKPLFYFDTVDELMKQLEKQ